MITFSTRKVFYPSEYHFFKGAFKTKPWRKEAI
jgi:hypothetical protein